MIDRAQLQAFLIANNLEAAANDQSSLCLIEKLVGLLRKVTPEMESSGSGVLIDHVSEVPLGQLGAREVWDRMWAARFGGE